MKYQFIYKAWWKYLTLLTLLYVFVIGFNRPLKPGILEISERDLTSGETFSFEVSAYNTGFDQGDQEIEAYLKLDSIHVAKFDDIEIVDRNSLIVKGTLPAISPYSSRKQASLLIYSRNEGYIILTNAVSVLPGDSGIVGKQESWNASLRPYDTQWSFEFPFLPILFETVRNMFFHVAIWMAMFVLLIVGLIYSIKYLRNKNIYHDAVASSFTNVAVFWGILGLITGAFWAKTTWGAYWTDDPKLNMSAVAMMIYIAYSLLRSSINDADKRARVSAAYNIFAFVAMIPLIFIIPRMTDGLHPGNGGNPALGGEDLDSTLRLVFYPAIIGYTLLGVWLSAILYRIRSIEIRRIHKKI